MYGTVRVELWMHVLGVLVLTAGGPLQRRRKLVLEQEVRSVRFGPPGGGTRRCVCKSGGMMYRRAPRR